MTKPMKAKSPKKLKKVAAIDTRFAAQWHKVFYQVHQIERALRPEELTLGRKIAVLEQRASDYLVIEEPKFYLGVISEVGGDGENDLITVEYEANPYCQSVTMGRKYLARFAIPAKLNIRTGLPA